MSELQGAGTAGTSRSDWHFTPEVPLRLAPFYDRPLRFGAIAKHVIGSWTPFGERFAFLLIALGIWTFFSPSLERTTEFRFDWIFEIWVRNLVLITIIAGGLHLYLYTFRRQGEDWRYDRRAYPAKGKAFVFGNQLWDNVLFALGSGVTVWTAYESFFMWAYANSVASLITLEEHPILFVALILLIPYWAGFHFYVQHRIMHWPPLYRLVHYRHHRNINLAPWSGMSLHPAEHVVDQSDCLLFLFIPSHPVHVIFNLMFRTVGAISSHTGYDGLRLTRSRRFEFGDFFHHLHHRYFDCNYGSLDTPWDRLCGSFHDGTPESHQRIKERRRAMRARSGRAPAR